MGSNSATVLAKSKEIFSQRQEKLSGNTKALLQVTHFYHKFRSLYFQFYNIFVYFSNLIEGLFIF